MLDQHGTSAREYDDGTGIGHTPDPVRFHAPWTVVGTAGRYMTLKLLGVALLAILALSGPVILVSLFNLPSLALTFERLWRVVYAVASMILIHTVPVLTAVALIWAYMRFLSEGVVVTLHAAGRSTLAVTVPGLIVAASAAGLGYTLSTVVAPSNAKHIHDVLHFLRRDMDVSVLEAGRFYSFEKDTITIFFKDKAGEDRLIDVFISQKLGPDAKGPVREEVYYADQALVAGSEGNRALILIDGGAVIDTGGPDGIREIDFKRAVWRPNAGQPHPIRGYVFYDELATGAFWAARTEAFADDATARLWLREALKRFVFPLLALTNTVFGLGILFAVGPMSGRDQRPGLVSAAVCNLTIAVHCVLVFMTEAVASVGLPLAALTIALILAQAAIGVALFVNAERPWLRGRLHGFGYAVAQRAQDLAEAVVPRAKESAARPN